MLLLLDIRISVAAAAAGSTSWISCAYPITLAAALLVPQLAPPAVQLSPQAAVLNTAANLAFDNNSAAAAAASTSILYIS
jgi:hypothetical protein